MLEIGLFRMRVAFIIFFSKEVVIMTTLVFASSGSKILFFASSGSKILFYIVNTIIISIQFHFKVKVKL